jgi:hypothetical protein
LTKNNLAEFAALRQKSLDNLAAARYILLELDAAKRQESPDGQQETPAHGRKDAKT